MTEPLVTKEQALALKELGMELPYIVGIDPINDNPKVIYTPQLPTVALTLKFMRERYGLFLTVEPRNYEGDLAFVFIISNYIKDIDGIWHTQGIKYRQYEKSFDEAESAGLDKLIEIAKQNSN